MPSLAALRAAVVADISTANSIGGGACQLPLCVTVETLTLKQYQYFMRHKNQGLAEIFGNFWPTPTPNSDSEEKIIFILFTVLRATYRTPFTP